MHLRFCIILARMQLDGGRYFIYERPKTAASWKNPQVDGLAAVEGVFKTEFDQC